MLPSKKEVHRINWPLLNERSSLEVAKWAGVAQEAPGANSAQVDWSNIVQYTEYVDFEDPQVMYDSTYKDKQYLKQERRLSQLSTPSPSDNKKSVGATTIGWKICWRLDVNLTTWFHLFIFGFFHFFKFIIYTLWTWILTLFLILFLFSLF